ncbi:cob(I)yrinic acid a,c-diamide adenosyltransferase [Rhodovibrionaceae bacterium A322]
MVKLTRIYTRGGDKGKTSLGTGKRVPKHDLRVEAYGTVDELNAVVGVARVHSGNSTREGMPASTLDKLLSLIQNDLFDLGADLCCPPSEKENDPDAPEPLRIVAAQVTRLEEKIDHFNEALEPLTSFILPGGSSAAAHLHHARTLARRAERQMTALAEVETVNPEAIQYINRLSDLFFVLARYCNDKGRSDVLWVPGKNR